MSDNAPPPIARLGAFVRERRETMGLSQQAVADRARVHLRSVIRLEMATTDEWKPRANTLAPILLALDITVPEVTKVVDDPEMYVKIVAEMGKLETTNFRANIAKLSKAKKSPTFAEAKAGAGAPAQPPPLKQADLLITSPDGITSFVYVQSKVPTDRARVATEIADIISGTDWAASRLL
jgi:transcriptional regulator with XRE-family HTH domain